MNKKIKIASIILILGLTACGGSSSSFTNTSNSDSSGTSNVNSSSINNPISLEKAIENTSNYNLFYKPQDSDETHKSYVEINSDSDFCYINDLVGYTILDSDNQFVHSYGINVNNDNQLELNMYGRIGSVAQFDEIKNNKIKFIDCVTEFKDLFSVNSNNPWLYQYFGTDLAYTFSQYFELKGFSYCNYFEIKIGYDGRISEFNAGEYYTSDLSDLVITEEFLLEEGGLKNTLLYENWVKSGRVITNRIFDYKSFYQQYNHTFACYDKGEIEATVSAIDYSGAFYVANYDDSTGPVGMKVVQSNSSTYIPKINDIVRIKGDIFLSTNINDKDAFSPYFINSSVEKIGESSYAPSFSEESIVDQYGPGVFAAYYLCNSPIFSQSLYCGYGYVSNVPESANELGDTEVEIHCPDWVYNQYGDYLKMTLYIPKEFGISRINEILDDLRSLGDYVLDPLNAKLASLNNVLCFYDFEAANANQIRMKLYATDNSLISHRLSFDELLEKEYGITNFPVISTSDKILFHFGELSGLYLESFYGLSQTSTYGLYLSTTCTDLQQTSFLSNLENSLGATFIDAIAYSFTSNEHRVYQLNDVFIDVVLPTDNDSSIKLFIYRANEMVHSLSIEEKIEQKCGSFFSGDDFIKLEGTYDKDYHFYSLSSYAGHKFEKGNELAVATMDINEDRYQELRAAYRNAGFKQYRIDINDPMSTPYTYNTRGINHTIYYKQNNNGKFTFLDFAQYPTTDYTFAKHNSFQYRVEILIYEGDSPLYTNYSNSLTELIKSGMSDETYFEWTLPSDYKAEIYYEQDGNVGDRFYDYGYTFHTDAFVYPSSSNGLDELYNYIVSVFVDHGFTKSYDGKKGSCYSLQHESESYLYYFYIIKDEERGFVRIINSIGGVDF